MSTLMVTPYAPYRDGIAAYAVQEVRRLRAEGHDVEVCSPTPSAAHRHLVVGSNQGLVRLIALARDYDRLVIQAFPELLFGACARRPQRLLQWRLLERLFRQTPTELRLHELDYGAATVDGAMRRQAARALRAAELTVHTEPERRRLVEEFDLDPSSIALVDHGRDFVPMTRIDKAGARAELDLDAESTLFLSIGFLQRHKGFDRGLRAFSRAALADTGARIVVVGSARLDDHPELIGYVAELEDLARSTPGAEVRQTYVSDADFDRYLIAADCLVLPYREIWSSGVVERAKLFDLPVIVSDVGGLADQIGDGSAVVADDDQLLREMAARAGAALADAATPLGRHDLQRLVSGDDGPDGRPRLERIPPLGPAHASSARPVVPQVKRLIQRLTGWQLVPVFEQFNELLDALVEERRRGWTSDRHVVGADGEPERGDDIGPPPGR